MSYPAKRLEVEVKQDPKAEDTNVILNKSMKDDRKDSSLGQHYFRIPSHSSPYTLRVPERSGGTNRVTEGKEVRPDTKRTEQRRS